MSDTKTALERARERALRFVGDEDPFVSLRAYRDRRRRNRRIASGVLALALVVAGVGAAIALSHQPTSVTIGGVDEGLADPNGPCFPGETCWDMDVYVVRTDGTDVRRLGYGNGRDLATSWSPDGTRIAFAVADGVDDEHANIYTMAADGSDVRQLTSGSQLDLFPVYSPDGSKIAFTSDRSGSVEIWMMNADGSDLVALTDFVDDGFDEYHPTWSPDGSQIAFVRGHVPPGADGELWVVNTDGSDAHQIFGAPLVSFPSWSPDGSRIAFGTGTWPHVRLGVLDLGSGAVSDLGDGYMPHWSPDGAQLEYSIASPGSGFAIMDLESGRPGDRRIVRTSGWAGAWSPDGTQIVFSDGPPNVPGALAPPTMTSPAVAGWLDDGTPYIVVRHEDGTLTAVEAISPHVATGGIRKLIGWCASSRTFDDPFHGSKFDEYGRYLLGPSPTGLATFHVEPSSSTPGFRLGERVPPPPRGVETTRPQGPFCLDTNQTPLLMPGTVSLAAADPSAPDTPASLIQLPEPPFGSRWEIDATLLLEPDGSASLCASVVAGRCIEGAPVEGPRIDGGEPLVVPGRWFVMIRDGTFVDPLRVG